MKRHWLPGLAALLTIIALGLAVFTTVRRRCTERRLAELEQTDRTIQAAILAPRTPVAAARHLEGDRPENTSRVTSASPAVAKPAARPDLNEIFSAHPELQAAYEKATAGRLQQTYGRLWDRMGLSSAQIEQVTAIMIRDDENEMDLAMTAQALGLPADDPALRRFRREETAVTQSALESLLGPQGYQNLRDYNRVLTMRSTAEDVASFTAGSGSPMTGPQTEQLTRVLAEASASYRNGGRPNWTTTDWDDVLGKASAFLTPPQLAALRAKAQQAKAAGMLAQFYASQAKH